MIGIRKQSKREEDEKIPVAVQTFLWNAARPFLKPVMVRAQCQNSCSMLEKILVQDMHQDLSIGLSSALQEISRWKFLQLAFPHIMHCSAAIIKSRGLAKDDGAEEREFTTAEKTLMYTLHWILTDTAADECEEKITSDSPFLHPLSSVRLFVHLFAPILHLVGSNEMFASCPRLEWGLPVWQALREHRPPPVPSFVTPAKPRRCRSLDIGKRPVSTNPGLTSSSFIVGNVYSGGAHQSDNRPKFPVQKHVSAPAQPVEREGTESDRPQSAGQSRGVSQPNEGSNGMFGKGAGNWDSTNGHSWSNKPPMAQPPVSPGAADVRIEEATVFDVAVVQCLLLPQWEDEGILWGLKYLEQRFSSILAAARESASPAFAMKGCNTFPLPLIQVSGPKFDNSPSRIKKNLSEEPNTGSSPQEDGRLESSSSPRLKTIRSNIPKLQRQVHVDEGDSIRLCILESEDEESEEAISFSVPTLPSPDASPSKRHGIVGDSITIAVDDEFEHAEVHLTSPNGVSPPLFPCSTANGVGTDAMFSSGSTLTDATLSPGLGVPTRNRNENCFAGPQPRHPPPTLRPRVDISIASENKANGEMPTAPSEDDFLEEILGSTHYVQANGQLNYGVVLNALHRVVRAHNHATLSYEVLNLLERMIELGILSSSDRNTRDVLPNKQTVRKRGGVDRNGNSGVSGSFKHPSDSLEEARKSNTGARVKKTSKGNKSSANGSNNQFGCRKDSDGRQPLYAKKGSKDSKDSEFASNRERTSDDYSIVSGSTLSGSRSHRISTSNRDTNETFNRQKSTDSSKCVELLEESEMFSLTTGILIWTITSMGCSHCAHHSRGFSPVLEEVKRKALQILLNLHTINDGSFVKTVQSFVKEAPLVKVFGFFHSFLGYCRFSDILGIHTDAAKGGYANNFLQSISGRGWRGIEGVIMAKTLKLLVDRLVNESLTVRDDLYYESRNFFHYAGEFHGGSFRRVALSGLLKPAKTSSKHRDSLDIRGSNVRLGSNLEAEADYASDSECYQVKKESKKKLRRSGSIELDKSSTDRLHEPVKDGRPAPVTPSVRSEETRAGKVSESGKRQESGKASGASLPAIGAATVAFISLKNIAKEKIASKRKGIKKTSTVSEGTRLLREKQMVEIYAVRSGMLRFNLLLEFGQPGTIPEPAFLAALLDLDAPVVSRSCLLLECAFFVHKCTQDDWPKWMTSRIPIVTAKESQRILILHRMAGKLFYQWAEALGVRLEEVLQAQSIDLFSLITMPDQRSTEDYLDEAIVNRSGKSCPHSLKIMACLLLSEITTFLREKYQRLPTIRWAASAQDSNPYSSAGPSNLHHTESQFSATSESLPSPGFRLQQSRASSHDEPTTPTLITPRPARSDVLSIIAYGSNTSSVSQLLTAGEDHGMDETPPSVLTNRDLHRQAQTASAIHPSPFKFPLLGARGPSRQTSLSPGRVSAVSGESSEAKFVGRSSIGTAHLTSPEQSVFESTSSVASAYHVYKKSSTANIHASPAKGKRSSMSQPGKGMARKLQKSMKRKRRDGSTSTKGPRVSSLTGVSGSGTEGREMEETVSMEPIPDIHVDYHNSLPWLKVLIKVASTSNFMCKHGHHCHPLCFGRLSTSAMLLCDSIAKVYQDRGEEDLSSKQESAVNAKTHTKTTRAYFLSEKQLSLPKLIRSTTALPLAGIRKKSESKFNSNKQAEGKSNSPQCPPIISYLKSHSLNMLNIPAIGLLKGAAVLTKETYPNVAGIAWELLGTEEQETKRTAASLLLTLAVLQPTLIQDLIMSQLQHSESAVRIQAVKKFFSMWKHRYEVTLLLEPGAMNSFLKMPPAYIDYTLPSPMMGTPGQKVADPPWMPQFKFKLEDLVGQEKKSILPKSIVLGTNPRKKQQQELLSKAVQMDMKRRHNLREGFPLTTIHVPLMASRAVSENCSAPREEENAGEGDEEGESEKPVQKEIVSPVPVFPSALCYISLYLVDMLEDEGKHGALSVGSVAYSTIWSCMVEDPSLFFRYFFERITRRKSCEEVFASMRSFLLHFHPLPPLVAYTLFNHMIGYILFYERDRDNISWSMKCRAFSILWQVAPQVQGICFRDLKATLKKLQCETVIMVTAHLPCTNKVIVQWTVEEPAGEEPTVSLDSTAPYSRTSTAEGKEGERRPIKEERQVTIQVQEETQFSLIVEESLRHLDIHNDVQDYQIADSKTGRMYAPGMFVRDFYPFRRSGPPLLQLIRFDREKAYDIQQEQMIEFKFLELSKVMLAGAILGSAYEDRLENHVLFLHEEFLKQMAFPRKALECSNIYYSGENGTEMYEMDKMHKLAWLQFLTVFFQSIPSTFGWTNEMQLFLNVINASLLIYCEDYAFLRLCLGLYLHASHHYKHIFGSDGFALIMPAILKVYLSHPIEETVKKSIEFIHKQFYILHRQAYLLQFMGCAEAFLHMSQFDRKNVADKLFHLLLIPLVEVEDEIGLFDLINLKPPLTTLDFCYEQNEEYDLLTHVINTAVTVVIYNADSPRAAQMLNLLRAIMPPYMAYVKRTSEENDGARELKAKLEALKYMELSQSFRTLLKVADGLTKNYVFTVPGSGKHGDGRLGAGVSATVDNPAMEDNDLSSRLNRLEEGVTDVTDSRGTAIDEQLREYTRIRNYLFDLLAEYYRLVKSRLVEHKQHLTEGIYKNMALLDLRSHMKLAEVAQTLIKIANMDGDTLAMRGLAKYMTELLPEADWTVSSGSAAMSSFSLLVKRVERLFHRFHSKRAEFKNPVEWTLCSEILNGLCLTFSKSPSLHKLLPTKTLVHTCLNIVLDDTPSLGLAELPLRFDSGMGLLPNYTFCSTVSKLVSLHIAAVGGDSYNLHSLLGSKMSFTVPRKLEMVLIYFLLPLCLRSGASHKDSPLSLRDIRYILSALILALNPESEAVRLLGSIDTASGFYHHSPHHHHHHRSHPSNTVAHQSQLEHTVCKAAFLGLRVVILCYSDHLGPLWLPLKKCLLEIGSKPHVHYGLPLWKFWDFLITHRTPLFVMMKAYLKLNVLKLRCDNDEQLSGVQHKIKQKLNKFIYPTNRTELLMELVEELHTAREVMIQQQPKDPPPSSEPLRKKKMMEKSVRRKIERKLSFLALSHSESKSETDSLPKPKPLFEAAPRADIARAMPAKNPTGTANGASREKPKKVFINTNIGLRGSPVRIKANRLEAINKHSKGNVSVTPKSSMVKLIVPRSVTIQYIKPEEGVSYLLQRFQEAGTLQSERTDNDLLNTPTFMRNSKAPPRLVHQSQVRVADSMVLEDESPASSLHRSGAIMKHGYSQDTIDELEDDEDSPGPSHTLANKKRGESTGRRTFKGKRGKIDLAPSKKAGYAHARDESSPEPVTIPLQSLRHVDKVDRSGKTDTSDESSLMSLSELQFIDDEDDKSAQF